MFADETSSAFWVAIIVAIGGVLSQIWNSWLQYKQNAKLKVMKEDLQTNTTLTQQTKRKINGRMTEYVAEVRRAAHADGVKAGLLQATQENKPQ